MSAKVGFVCISCLLSDLVGKSVRELTWNAEEKEGKCCFNHIFVNNHLRLYIMVFFYLHHVHVFGTSSCLIDWNMLTWNVSMKSNISELLELLFFFFFFFNIFKGIGHVNAVTLHVVCLHLGNFKCFYKKSIFIHLWKHLTTQQPQVTLKTSSVFFFFYPELLYNRCIIFVCVHSWLKGYMIAKGYTQRCFCTDFINLKKKNISLLRIPNWCNVHVSRCNVFILTVKIFCEKEKID